MTQYKTCANFPGKHFNSDGVYAEHSETVAVSHGTSHVSAVSTPLQ